MFLILSLMVVSVVYWVSALLAELILDSGEERSLPVAIRTSFGFFFAVFYFAAVWQIVSIKYAWLFGLGLMLVYFYGKYGSQFISVAVDRLRINGWVHIRYFSIFLIGANVFFAPMFIANNFGPFTEGGGDVSIYADVSHVLTNKNLTEYGNPAALSDIGDNLKEILHVIYDPQVVNEIIAKHYHISYVASLSPPLAEAPVNRILALRTMSSFLYAPYAQYNFLSSTTNYHIYYGIQAFLYCIILVGTWHFFSLFGKKSAVVALLSVLFSHGLISVFYNMYGAQTFSIAFSILVLNALPYIRLNSWAGLRTYGAGAACIWGMYVHFLTIILPLMASAWVGRSFNIFEKKEAASVVIPNNEFYRKLSNFVSVAIFSGLFMLLLLGGARYSIKFFQSLFTNIFNGTHNAYMGEHVTFFSWKGMSFLFGILSQQHYLPFASEYGWLNNIVMLGSGLGGVALILGVFLMYKIYRKDFRSKYQNSIFILYILLIVTVVPHVYLSQMSLYTQAKGAQNVLVYFYVILLLPLAIGLSVGDQNVAIKKLTKILLMTLILFCTAIAVPRVVFMLRLSFGQDRAIIMERSYFLEADKIKKSDAMPFVLLEPRKSADLYVSDQPFFGARFVSTRHLIWQRLNPTNLEPEVVLAPDLFETEDISHLWLLRAERVVNKEKWPSLNDIDYTWKSERLVDKKDPDILLFGSDYERNFGERPGNAKGKFSYLKNGAAMLYLPRGGEGNVEVTLEPRDEKDYAVMVKEVGDRLTKGEMGSNVTMATDGKFITLTSKVAAEDKPTLKTIARYGSEFWLNVRLNGNEL